MAKCSERDKARHRENFRKNRAEHYARMQRWRDRKRLEFIAELGGKCVHCGESNPVVLDFDHIHDDGAEHRRATNGAAIVRYFSKHGINTKQFQLLCKNCNWIKEYKRRKNAIKKFEAA